MDNIVGEGRAPELASQLLDDPELLLVSVEEPPMFIVADATLIGTRQCWRR